MAETAPAVVLLFDDGALGEQLRVVLQEHGARIVHEGALSSLNRQVLQDAGADVLVINLDDEDDETLDRLYETIEGDHPRVVFNDARASRELDGWDRARWARHLALKVLAVGDVDPPRPEGSHEVAVAADEAVAIEPAPPADAPPEPVRDVASEQVVAPVEPASEAVANEQQTEVESASLAAELEALMAADDPAQAAENEFGDGLNYAAGDGEALHDGNFGAEPLGELDESIDEVAVEPDVADDLPTPVEPSTEATATGGHADFQLDHLELAPLAEEVDPAPLADQVPAAAFKSSAPGAHESWSLVDDETPTSQGESDERVDPGEFGIEKLSAADYLAPEADDQGESPITPGLSLELVSLEEAVAPTQYEPNEIVLDELSGALTRVVLLGATTESTASVCEFLSLLPSNLRLTVLHTQHLAGKSAEPLVEYLATHCPLPVRLAAKGVRARQGEVLVVPSDQQVRLMRDGSLELQPIDASAPQMPSIDASFTMAANAFGRDALAIVFAGHSTDAVGGCQAIHDRGGQVWVETPSGEHFADMVSGIMAERLSHYAGTPQELAARLVEQFSMEGRQ